MKFEKFATKGCCGKVSVAYKLDGSLSTDLILLLSSFGFKELKHFTASGYLYMESEAFIISGRFNSNTLQLKCKKDCDIDTFDSILLGI